MKKIFFLALFIVVLAGSCVSAANAPDGFRGIKWGTPISNLSGMIYTNDVGDRLKMYIRPTDKLSVGNVPLKYLFYDFIDGKFTGVIMMLEMDSRKDDIILMLNSRYGQGEPQGNDTFLWKLSGSGNIPFVIAAEPINMGNETFYRIRYFTPEEVEYMINSLQAGADEL